MGESTAAFGILPDIAARDIPGGLMLVNLQTGAAFKLNQVGAAIWKRLDGTTGVAAIVADLQEVYRVPAQDLHRDVTALLADLEKQGLIATASPG